MNHKSNIDASPLNPAQQEAMRVAVYLAGGAREVARRMGYSTGESVRRFYAGEKPVPAEKCRDMRTAVDNRLTLAEIRPDLYSGLTSEALGYVTPAHRARKARQ